MDKLIIYTDPVEGNVCILTPAVPPGATWKLIDASAIPADRSFRNAWKIEGDAIAEDWAKCVEITKDRLRAERGPLLDESDVQAMRDMEATGAVQPATAALKQALRDLPALADSAKSRSELLALSADAVVASKA